MCFLLYACISHRSSIVHVCPNWDFPHPCTRTHLRERAFPPCWLDVVWSTTDWFGGSLSLRKMRKYICALFVFRVIRTYSKIQKKNKNVKPKINSLPHHFGPTLSKECSELRWRMQFFRANNDQLRQIWDVATEILSRCKINNVQHASAHYEDIGDGSESRVQIFFFFFLKREKKTCSQPTTVHQLMYPGNKPRSSTEDLVGFLRLYYNCFHCFCFL